MSTELNSVLCIGPIRNSRDGDGIHEIQCAVCLAVNPSFQTTMPSCSHVVCQTCYSLVAAGNGTVVCVLCQVRSVSPAASERDALHGSRSPLKLLPALSGMAGEKKHILQNQLKQLRHLDHAVYKPLIRHFDKLIEHVESEAQNGIEIIESSFRRILTALKKRKDLLIRAVMQKAKLNKAYIENKKSKTINEREKLMKYCKSHQAKVKTGRRYHDDRIEISQFLKEAEDFQRQARHTSTSNAITTLDEIEIDVESSAEGVIKESLERFVRKRDVVKTCHSRVGTPCSSPQTSFDPEECPRQHTAIPEIHVALSIDQSPDTSPLSTSQSDGVSFDVTPIHHQLAPNLTLPISPRDARSPADGREHDNEPCRLPDINTPSPRIERQQRRHQPDMQNDAECLNDCPLSLPASLSSDVDNLRCTRSIDRRHPDQNSRRQIAGRRPRRMLPVIKKDQWIDQRHSPKPPPITTNALERPNGMTCFSKCQTLSPRGKDDVVWVADCGTGGIGAVSLNGRELTHFRSVWADDGDSAKAQGVFDLTITRDEIIVLSDSQEKKVLLLQKDRPLKVIKCPHGTDPRGVASDGERIFVCDQGNQCVQMITLSAGPDGSIDADRSAVTPISLGKPHRSLPIDPYFIAVNRCDGRILVTDHSNQQLILVSADNSQPPRRANLKAMMESENSSGIRPTGVAWLPDGRGAVVADQRGHRLVIVDEELNIVATYGKQGSGPGEFLFPHGLVFTSASILAVCDMNNARVQRISLGALLGHEC
ncbi:uncharacterized protein [Diadema setosum]|uniref:uncharacterized protein n=1 Tax=Diadema setosum TaxID=31175 RepID=UPI003B3A6680